MTPHRQHQEVTLSTSRAWPWPSGKDFFTSCRSTAGGDCSILRPVRLVAGATSACHTSPLPLCSGRSSANSNGIHWYANATPQQQRTKHEEKLIGLVLRQLIQVENLHDVGATVPEKIGVQWPGGIAPKALRTYCGLPNPIRPLRYPRRAATISISLKKARQSAPTPGWA